MTVLGAALAVHAFPYSDPLTAFAALRGSGMAVLLDSAAAGPDTGRYSAIAVEPVAVVRAGWPDAFDRMTALSRVLPGMTNDTGWPIGPGLFGMLGYELRRALERSPSRHPADGQPPDLLLGLFDTVVVFDAVDHRSAVISCAGAEAKAHRMLQRIVAAPPLLDIDWTVGADWCADHTPDAYATRVDHVLDYIRAGDIYQANFTQRWVAGRPPSLDAFELYRRLRGLSPAPYAAFIDDGDGVAIISASPERFLKLSADGLVDTRPIKGTRPRGRSADEDIAFAAALEASAKDHAENLMIVDLLRNDLGRVAETGSVKVPELNALYSFANVHHLVSTITAKLRQGLGPIDLIRASFPGGSVTGTPKIRAMEIIDELEVAQRGLYCGAIGWIGLDGAMELSIAIRTMTLTPDRVIAQAGGGIVSDSDPAGEYREALTKAGPMLATLDRRYRT